MSIQDYLKILLEEKTITRLEYENLLDYFNYLVIQKTINFVSSLLLDMSKLDQILNNYKNGYDYVIANPKLLKKYLNLIEKY